MATGRVETGLIQIIDCSRGLSDWYPTRLNDDQLAEAFNVEFWSGAVCGRRPGVTVKFSGNAGLQSSMFVHTPTVNRADDELWRTSETGIAKLTQAYVQTGITPNPLDAFTFMLGVDWASIHGKLFVAAKNSSPNRLHVWDGTTLRRAGLSPMSNAPGATNGSVPGTLTGTRTYRTRLVVQVAGVVTRRSEPSPETTFTPSGGSSSVAVFRGTGFPNEGETHYEIEEKAPNGFWYRITTQPIATVQYDDTLALSAVATAGPQSADVGDYTLPPSAQWLTVDDDRLLMGGNWENQAQSARVSWTPLQSQVGVGNDERIIVRQGSYIDFDTLDGGGLTGIKAWEGKVIVFKRQQVHQMIRSASLTRAYLPDCLSRRHGAIPFSIVEGTDVDGLSCLYFLDPDVGPMQLGVRGLRVLCPQMQRTWKARINLNASQVCSVTYHPDKRQVWWHVALDGQQTPWLRWMYSVESDGLVFHTMPSPVRAAVRFNSKPHLLIDAVASPSPLLLQADDYTSQTDYGTNYRAYIRSKAYQFGVMVRRFQIESAILEVEPMPSTDLTVACVRDFGVEVRPIATVMAGALPYVILPIDNAYLAEALAMQFEIGDPVARAVGPWQVHGFTATYALGSPSTGRG